MSGLRGSYANGFAPRDGAPLYPDLWRGCVGAWAPCLGPSGLTLRDWSGYKNHGTLTNMDAGTDWVASQGRYALKFDGTNDFLSLSSLVIPLPFSLSFWFRPATVAVADHRLFGPTGGAYPQFFCRLNNSSLEVLNAAGGAWNAVATGIAANAWTHVVLNCSSSGAVAIVNGIESSTVAAPAAIVNNFSFGSKYLGSFGAYFSGQLDDVMIFLQLQTVSRSKLLASRRGIAYELSPRRRAYSILGPSFSAAWARRQSLIIGGGLQ